MKSENLWIEPMFGPPMMDVTTKMLDVFLNTKFPVELASKHSVDLNEPLPRFVSDQWAMPPEDMGDPPMYEVFKAARHDATHTEHERAKETGYVGWDHDDIHSDVITEQFS